MASNRDSPAVFTAGLFIYQYTGTNQLNTEIQKANEGKGMYSYNCHYIKQ